MTDRERVARAICLARLGHEPGGGDFPDDLIPRAWHCEKGHWYELADAAIAALDRPEAQDGADKVMHEDAPRAVVGEIGNQVHNLGCSIHDDDDLQEALAGLASRLWRVAQTLPADPEAQDGVASEPCGGCGESDPQKRCMGCLHDFGDKSSKWVARLSRAED